MPRITSPQRLRPRKQPRQKRSEASVAAIVEGAARILEQHGHDGFTTNAVAKMAGVSIGSLYQYFPNKEALLGAIIARETNLLLTETAAVLHVSSGRAALEGVISACVRHQTRRPALARLLDFEEARLSLDTDILQVRARFQATVEIILTRLDLPSQPGAAVAARDVVAIIKGMVDTAGEYGETDQHALSNRVGRAVLGYLSLSL